MPDPFAPSARGVERHLRPRLAIDIGTRIDGVAQNLVDGVVARLDPANLRVRVHLQRELVGLVAEPQPHTARRAGLGEALEHGADGGDDGLVGMEAHLAVGLAPDEADGKPTSQLATRRLVANAAVEAGSEHVQLRLAHRAFETEQQPVVEQRRVIDAVSVADQRVGEAGEIDETVPVGVVAGEPRHLETKDKSNAGERDLGSEARKSGARDGAGAGEPEVLVDDDDAILGPTELARFVGKCILPLCRLAIVLDLGCARLAQVDDGLTRETARRDKDFGAADARRESARPPACAR